MRPEEAGRILSPRDEKDVRRYPILRTNTGRGDVHRSLMTCGEPVAGMPACSRRVSARVRVGVTLRRVPHGNRSLLSVVRCCGCSATCPRGRTRHTRVVLRSVAPSSARGIFPLQAHVLLTQRARHAEVVAREVRARVPLDVEFLAHSFAPVAGVEGKELEPSRGRAERAGDECLRDTLQARERTRVHARVGAEASIVAARPVMWPFLHILALAPMTKHGQKVAEAHKPQSMPEGQQNPTSHALMPGRRMFVGWGLMCAMGPREARRPCEWSRMSALG